MTMFGFSLSSGSISLILFRSVRSEGGGLFFETIEDIFVCDAAEETVEEDGKGKSLEFWPVGVL